MLPKIKKERKIFLKININPETLCKVKEASHRTPHIIVFYLHEIARVGKATKTESRDYLWDGLRRKNL